jgi:6-methylsalicylate decarboxylase
MPLLISESTALPRAHPLLNPNAMNCPCCPTGSGFGTGLAAHWNDNSMPGHIERNWGESWHAATSSAKRKKTSRSAASGKSTSKRKNAPHRIDVHHHIMPPNYVSLVGADRIFRQSAGRVPPAIAAWTPQGAVEVMDKCGIATAITSVSAPGTWFGNVSLGRRVSRDCNEYAARLAGDFPGRFGTLAALPLPDVEGSLREIEYAFDVLRADGIALMTSYDNRWPGEKEFAAVFDELNRRKAVVFFHPTTPECCTGLITNVPDSSIEFLFDTVRTVTSLLYSGTLSRCPDIKFIFCHNGSAVPLLKDRISSRWYMARDLFEPLIPKGPLYELKKLYFECAGSTFPECYAPLLEMVNTRQLLVGTDYPWGRLTVKQTLDGLLKQGFSAKDLKLIERDNALRLFPRFA